MHKLAAFTLMELLVGMLVSSIVIAFGYGAYDLIYKQFLTYRSVKTKVLETMQFNTVVSRDFINAEYVTFSDNKLNCVSPGRTLTYELMDSVITRTDNEMTDTFKLVPGPIQIKPLYNNESGQEKLIGQFLLDVNVLGNTEHFTFTKRYSAQTIMNYEIQAQSDQ